MTITISSDEPSTIDRILQTLQPLRREKLVFDIKTDLLDDEDALKTAAIRERLRLKYVVNGEWATMDDEDRQDAALLESMLYDDENGLVEILEESDAKAFYHEMKSWAK